MDEASLLRRLVEVYSPSGNEAAAVAEFTRIAERLGLAASIDAAGNGIATRGEGRPETMVLGHVDTVDGELPVRLSDGRLHGRGAVDAKGPLIAALVAASSYDGPGRITVVAAVGEEKDSRGTRFLLPSHRPDFLVVGEPSGWEGVTIGYKGNLSVEVRFRGKRSHLSSPAPTTVEAALAFIETLRGFCGDHRGTSPFRSLTGKVHTIHTDRKGDNEVVTVGVNLRLPPSLPTDEVIGFLEARWSSGAYGVIDRSEGVEVDPRNEVVRSLSAAIRTNSGTPVLRRKLGTSDLNLTARAWRCPAAAYGPGDAHLSHTELENLDLDEFRKSVRVLREAFSSLHSRSAAVTEISSRARPGA